MTTDRVMICVRVGFLAFLFAVCSNAWGAKWALLVGVSDLPAQSKDLWLRAPRNDVQAMQSMLVKRGFLDKNIRVLADGLKSAEDPTAAAIQAAMAQIARSAEAGDFVLLYFSGHGAQVLGRPKRYREPDGLSEIFLARDTVGWDKQSREVPGSIGDDQLDAAIDAILAKGAFVWAVFDTCSAASLTRGGPFSVDTAEDYIRYRGARPDQLTAVSGTRPSPIASNVLRPRQRYVAFFAAESHQYAPEMKLPRGSVFGKPHGLLTWSLLNAMDNAAVTYRELFRSMLTLYQPVVAELDKRFPDREPPSPVVEGLLDTPLFVNVDHPVARPPIFSGIATGQKLAVDAGILDGVVAGKPVRVTMEGSPGGMAGLVTEVRLNSAVVQLTGVEVKTGSVNVAMIEPPEEYALHVAVSSGADQWNRLQVDLDSIFPVNIRRTQREIAELIVSDAGSGFWKLEARDADSAGSKWVAWALSIGGRKNLSWQSTAALLRGAAQLKWYTLLERRARVAGNANDMSVSVKLAQRTDRGPISVDLTDSSRALALKSGSWMLEVENASRHSVDLIALLFDGQGQVRVLYPQNLGDANRLEAKTSSEPVRLRIPLKIGDSEAGASEHLVVVAAPARPQSAPRSFGLGDQRQYSLQVAELLRGSAGLPQSAALVLLADLTAGIYTQTQSREGKNHVR